MDREQYELFTKVHNELINRMRIKADKYEREDSFSAYFDVIDGKKSMKDALIHAFRAVYNVEISNAIYESCYALCKGFR